MKRFDYWKDDSKEIGHDPHKHTRYNVERDIRLEPATKENIKIGSRVYPKLSVGGNPMIIDKIYGPKKNKIRMKYNTLIGRIRHRRVTIIHYAMIEDLVRLKGNYKSNR